MPPQPVDVEAERAATVQHGWTIAVDSMSAVLSVAVTSSSQSSRLLCAHLFRQEPPIFGVDCQ